MKVFLDRVSDLAASPGGDDFAHIDAGEFRDIDLPFPQILDQCQPAEEVVTTPDRPGLAVCQRIVLWRLWRRIDWF